MSRRVLLISHQSRPHWLGRVVEPMFQISAVQSSLPPRNQLGQFDLALVDLSSEAPLRINLRDLAGQLPALILYGHAQRSRAWELFEDGAEDCLDAETLSVHQFTVAAEKAVARYRHRSRRTERDFATEAVDQAAHELRTPTSVIQDLSQSMLDGIMGSLSEPQRLNLRIIAERARDMQRLLDDVLDARRAAQLGLAARRSDSAISILKEVKRIAGWHASRFRGTVRFQHQPDLPLVFCDRDQIARAAANLVINACKYCARGGTISITASRSEDGRHVEFAVADTGPGLTEEEVQRVTEKFYRAAHGETPTGRGFGLGLMIASQLVQANDGILRVESQPSTGSRFSLGVPLDQPVPLLGHYLRRVRGKGRSHLEIVAGRRIGLATTRAAEIPTQVRGDSLYYGIGEDRFVMASSDESDRWEAFRERVQASGAAWELTRIGTWGLGSTEVDIVAAWRTQINEAVMLDPAQLRLQQQKLEHDARRIRAQVPETRTRRTAASGESLLDLDDADLELVPNSGPPQTMVGEKCTV